jgi:hypothetical protein
MPQTTQPPPIPPSAYNADDGSPYGGVSLSGPAAPSGATGVCETNGQPDPCVLTGQDSRYRTSTNVNESNLAGKTSSNLGNNFGLAYFYKFDAPRFIPYGYEPASAQPLYISNVPYGTGTYNMLIAATLKDYVYAFDTSVNPGTELWNTDLIASGHCGSLGTPFANNQMGNPGGSNLPYYGAVATPVIDTAVSGHPILHVVSACVPSGSPKEIMWFLDAIDLTTSSIIGTTQLTDAAVITTKTDPRYQQGGQSIFNSPYELSRASLLITHPSTGPVTGTYIYIGFGAGGGEVQGEDGDTYAYSGVLMAYFVQYSSCSSTCVATYTPLPAPASSYSGNFYSECQNYLINGTCPTTGIFPSTVYTAFSNGGYGTQGSGGGPASWSSGGCTQPPQSTCSPGANWINGAGIWGSSAAVSSAASGNVYAVTGNGAFACTTSGNECTSAASVNYFGESAIQFPAGIYPNIASGQYDPNTLSYSGSGWCELTFPNPLSSGGIPAIALFQVPPVSPYNLTIYQAGANYVTAPSQSGVEPSQISGYSAASSCSGTNSNMMVNVTPQLTSAAALVASDFYSAYVNTYNSAFPNYDGNAGAFLMNQELSRLDLDFGVCGPELLAHSGVNLFALTCDKVSNMYVMPTPEISGVSLGEFQTGDAGLVNGSGSNGTTYKTQAPFQVSRVTGNCEKVDRGSTSNGNITGNCDEVHSIPWFNDLAVVHPTNESVELFQGATTFTGNLQTGTTVQYSFGTSPAFDPCLTPNNCGSGEPFPPSAPNSKGGLMSIAATATGQTPATLWEVIPQPSGAQGGAAIGSLHGYSITFQNLQAVPPVTASLTSIYSWNGQACSGSNFALTGWFTPSFTEPTLANGTVYVSMVCGVTDGKQSQYVNCDHVPYPASVTSGIAAFTNSSLCP